MQVPHPPIASVTNGRFARRNGRGRERGQGRPEARGDAQIARWSLRRRPVEHIRVSTYAVLKSSDKMSESTDNLPTKSRNLPIWNPLQPINGQTGHDDLQPKISATERDAAFDDERASGNRVGSTRRV